MFGRNRKGRPTTQSIKWHCIAIVEMVMPRAVSQSVTTIADRGLDALIMAVGAVGMDN